MQRFIGAKEEFLLDQKSVEVNEGWGDVLPGLSGGENPGSRVLHILKSVQDVVWYTPDRTTLQ